jgi:polar amino acid transport system ATP-binding protein
VNVVELRNVHKLYGSHHVLRGIDLNVAAGEVVVLIGASGSGKSTLLRCVNLLETVDDGDVVLEGQVVTDPDVDPVAVRRRVGMVFQAFNLFPHLRVIDNVALAPRRVHGVAADTARARARALLERFGLADKADAWPDSLSGGQQQRAAIARALATEPVLLLLDEITSALDPELVAEVLDVVRDLAAEGTTMVLATHEMDFARRVASRVGFLHDGVLVEIGPPAQVLDDPQHERTRQFVTSAR